MQIIGVDEVGRGALFGPVFAGAVALNHSQSLELIKVGLTDSKKLSIRKRTLLVPLIEEASTEWSLGQASAREIDKFGIRHATELAMLRALQRISKPIELVLIDGSLPLRLWKHEQRTVIKGDNKYAEIAAASVIAKVARDTLIKRLSKKFPGYGLDKHVGYGTKLHKEALLNSGPTKLHRQSFLKKISPKIKS